MNYQKYVLMLLALVTCVATASTDKYRAMWRGNPSTTMVIGWNQVSGNSAVVYYDTVDHGTNTGAYAFSKSVDRTVSYKGMSNTFARLSGLTPDTLYYFVIDDSDSTSARMTFRTAPADDTPFTVIAGGDSRNNTSVRIDANKMVAKLKPLAVMFGGDMTDGDSSSEWQGWMDHWQNTITSDDRLIPIVAARGNHEGSNASISNLFDSPNSSIYFALTFGDNMLRSYTLNSEDVEGGSQASWLQSDLAANQQVSWRFAQYHKPMRPHVSSKSEGNSEYNAWAQTFYDYNMDLVVECDSHLVKSTWPIRPSSGSGSDEGFIRDDANGTVYVGEGTWGAPLRSANDSKNWTRQSGSFNQFKWISVSRNLVEIKTVQYDNVDSVGQVSSDYAYSNPSGLQTWGDNIMLAAPTAPSVSITAPNNNDLYNDGDTVSIAANASSPVGFIQQVDFYVDGNFISQDVSAPYTASWTASGNGNHTITAVATDDASVSVQDDVTIQVGVATITKRIASSLDDVEERDTGSMYTNSSDIELVVDADNQTVGLRFTNLPIPANAVISDASIQFTVDETDSGTTNLTIRAQDIADAPAFATSTNNVSNRATTGAYVNWSPPAWNSVGAAGADQRTPNLAAVVQEVVDGGWSSGNDMVFIITGSGSRTAEAYDGTSSSAALLSVTYSTGGGGGNISPNASFNYNANNLQVSFSNTSSDSDGSIASFSWNFGDGSTSTSTNPTHTYAVAGTYNVSLTVTDNEGATDTANATVTVTDPSGWTTVVDEDFESGWGVFNDGGGDCRRSSSDAAYAHQGTYCVRLRDDSSTSVMTSDSLNLSGYSELEISFWYRPDQMENGEDFFVEIDNGSGWQSVANYAAGSDFSNGNFYNPSVSVTSVSLTSSTRIRFRCDASSNSDRIFLDEIVVIAR